MNSIHEAAGLSESVFPRDLLVHEVSRLLLLQPEVREQYRDRIRMIDVLVVQGVDAEECSVLKARTALTLQH